MGATYLKDNSLGSKLRDIAPAQIGLAVVEAVIAYEWLLSGIDKCMSSQYLGGLAGSLGEMANGNPNTWYVWFLRHIAMALLVLPQPGGQAPAWLTTFMASKVPLVPFPIVCLVVLAVAVYVGRLRQKLEPDPAKPRYIVTVWGAGYRLDSGS